MTTAITTTATATTTLSTSGNANGCKMQPTILAGTGATLPVPIGGHASAKGGQVSDGANICAHKEEDLAALTACGTVCASLGGHQPSTGGLDALQASQIGVPGTTELQTPYITGGNALGALEVGVDFENYAAHRGNAGYGVGVMAGAGGGVVVQTVPIHYLAVTAQTLAVTRAKQGAGGSLSDGHDNSDPSDQAGDLEMEQDSRSSAGGFGEESDNNVTALAVANGVNLANVNDSGQHAMGTLTRQQQHSAQKQTQQQQQQILAGAGLGLPVGGLCSRHQALFGQSPLDVLPQLAPMPSLSMAGPPHGLISLGQSLQHPHSLPPHAPSQPGGGQTIQMEMTSLDPATAADNLGHPPSPGSQPPAPLTLQAGDGGGTLTHTLPRHHPHTQQQQTQLENGTLRGGTLIYGPSGGLTEVVLETLSAGNNSQPQLAPQSGNQQNNQQQNPSQNQPPSTQSQGVAQFPAVYTTSDKMPIGQTQLTAVQSQMTTPISPTTTTALHHPLQSSAAPTGCT